MSDSSLRYWRRTHGAPQHEHAAPTTPDRVAEPLRIEAGTPPPPRRHVLQRTIPLPQAPVQPRPRWGLGVLQPPPGGLGANIMLIGPLQFPGGNEQHRNQPGNGERVQRRRIIPTPVTPPLQVHEPVDHAQPAHQQEVDQEAIPSPDHPHGARHSMEYSPLRPQRLNFDVMEPQTHAPDAEATPRDAFNRGDASDTDSEATLVLGGH